MIVAALLATATIGVHMDYAAFDPGYVEVVVGDTVAWTNTATREHTVTGDVADVDSGRVAPGQEFTHSFAEPGSFAYHCSLHRFMRGDVEVRTILLHGPSAPVAPRTPVRLFGRAMPGVAEVTLQRDEGPGYADVARVPVVAGSFSTTLPATSAVYRAAAGTLTSPPIRITALASRLSVRTSTRAGRLRVAVHATPADPGGLVVLKLRLRERFGWWPVRRARLDHTSSASFVLPLRRSVVLRAVLTLRDGYTPLARSRVVRVAPRA